jgi:hypothetical protein
MNDPKVYLPFSLLIVWSIVHLSLSVPSFSMILHFPRFLYLSAVLAILTGLVVYYSYKNRFDFDNLYKLTGSTVLFSFVICLAAITFINMKYTTKNCNTSSYKLVGYKGRYTSGLGKLEKDKIKANQWILSILKNDKIETFVLDKDISTDNLVTKTMELEFCKGLLGTEYLNLAQIPK